MEIKHKCLRCGVELPEFDEKGQHNFCPASTPEGKIISLCMACKMQVLSERKKGA